MYDPSLGFIQSLDQSDYGIYLFLKFPWREGSKEAVYSTHYFTSLYGLGFREKIYCLDFDYYCSDLGSRII